MVECSVLIANYDGEEFLPACLDSILAQEFDGTVEIIVHDDASTDRSASLLQAQYPQVRVIQSETNVGFCVGNNRMAKLAQGKYLLLLNNDASLRPGALQALYERAESAPRDLILGLPQYAMHSGDLIDRGCIFDPFLNPVPNTDPTREIVGMIMGACLWIPQTLWERLGGFPEWFESLAEDLYLCCAAWNRGYEARVLACSGYDHHVGASFGGGKVVEEKLITTYRRRALSERNKTFTMLIFYPLPVLLLIFPVHIVLMIVEGIATAIANRSAKALSAIYFPALLAVLKQRSILARERKSAVSTRTSSIWCMRGSFTIMPYKLKMLLRHGFPTLR